ncbi:MAG: ABC transporter permease [Acidobacteria bacterium]|nr:MAG: ABC transporter permease [Acidobacteriota bacterium]PYU72491.1 MAG: ABC transporter permease [Acidobacteriota bacterium]
MHTWLQDVRYSLRQLIKSPGFTLTAVVSLALGIGATTAVFSVIYAALINPYPYPAADRIVRLTITSKAGSSDWVNPNGPQIRQLRQLPVVESVLAMDFQSLILTAHDLPENVNAITLISNGFDDLGVPPLLGRGLLPSDAIDGQEPQPVVVLSYRFWRKQFFANPDVLGKTLQLDRKNYQIVGVAAPRFTWYIADVYLPLKLTQDPGKMYVVDLLLKRGVTYHAADAALQPLLEQFAKDMPKHFPELFKVKVEGLNEWVVSSISGTLYLLFGAVTLLLAIGCGNVSILLLARGAVRQHELAVRAAVGAPRSRIVRQLLTESLLLAAIGALLGVLTSYGILAGIKALLPRYAFAPEVAVRINLPVLFFSVAVALGTGVLFGWWPALQLSRTQVGQMMQSNARRVAGSVRGRNTHNVLIAGQIALTMLLLAGAGSVMQGFVRLIHTPLGYDPHNVMSVGIPLRENSYTTWASRAIYFEQLRAKVAETPAVTMAAISSNATPPRNGWNSRFEILGKPGMEQQMASINLVNPGYFAVLRIPLLQGRVWNETENHDGAHVAVINRTLAQRYFPNGDAIGHLVKLPTVEDRPPEVLSAPNIADSWLQIVGIVEDARNDGLRNPIKPAVFVPYTLSMREGTQILVRSEVPPLTLLHAVRAQLLAVNPDQQTWNEIEDLDSWISNEPEWQQDHLAAWIFGVFAWLALALAAVGLYSVVSYTVAQRTKEFGIRIALGAQSGHVLRIVFVSTLGSVATGILAGLTLTLATSTILAKWAEGNSRDPIILLAETLLLSLVSAMACAIPARHACEVDPMTALRCE